ncbi:MAG: hypothetical protein EAY72_00520 [Bacteroidetes bacterium]|nr:MAG: hypothetical protein EAY72_00520 [Bacteroidota bacterium]
MKSKFSLIITLVIVIATMVSCKKESHVHNEVGNFQEAHKSSRALMGALLKNAKDREFKAVVLNECLKQKKGDYYVTIRDLCEALNNDGKYNAIVKELTNLADLYKNEHGGVEPILFYPRAETIEESSRNRETDLPYQGQQEAIGVIQDVFNPDYSSPGFIVNDGNQLVFLQNITEEYAWDNDVWVIGQEELVSDENMLPALEEFTASRVQGQREIGGIIQVTDLNAIEHWTSGKFEFKMNILNSSGVLINSRGFGRDKRRNFRNNRWRDYNSFIANWNTSTFGAWMYENWWEEDGGQSNSVTISFPPPSGQSGPTVSTTIPSRNLDDNLGVGTVQFTDPITQIYNITHMNFRRRN